MKTEEQVKWWLETKYVTTEKKAEELNEAINEEYGWPVNHKIHISTTLMPNQFRCIDVNDLKEFIHSDLLLIPKDIVAGRDIINAINDLYKALNDLKSTVYSQ